MLCLFVNISNEEYPLYEIQCVGVYPKFRNGFNLITSRRMYIELCFIFKKDVRVKLLTSFISTGKKHNYDFITIKTAMLYW